jgi:hypothetical protein
MSNLATPFFQNTVNKKPLMFFRQLKQGAEVAKPVAVLLIGV